MREGETLTGRRRYALRHHGFFNPRLVLVLQVERKFISTTSIGGYIDSEWVTNWRDASLEDLTVHDIVVDRQ